MARANNFVSARQWLSLALKRPRIGAQDLEAASRVQSGQLFSYRHSDGCLW